MILHVIDTRNVPAVVHGKTTTTPVNFLDVQNNIELPMVHGRTKQ